MNPAPEGWVLVRVENVYSDGHASAVEVRLPAPVGDLIDWWQDEVYEHTGDGHGIDRRDLHSLYTATIIDGSRADLIGEMYEWGD